MSTQNFPMFWLLTEYSTENSCVWWVSWKTTSFCASLGSFCLPLQHTECNIFIHSLPVQTIRGFVFIVLSSPKFMFRDFAKVESRNLGWKSGLCNNFTFVTLANSCGTQGHARTGAERREEELIARKGNYHALTNVWSRKLETKYHVTIVKKHVIPSCEDQGWKEFVKTLLGFIK